MYLPVYYIRNCTDQNSFHFSKFLSFSCVLVQGELFIKYIDIDIFFVSFSINLIFPVFNSCIIFPHAAHMNLKGLALTDIILVHLYMKSMADFAVINSVYMTAFDLCPPAR